MKITIKALLQPPPHPGGTTLEWEAPSPCAALYGFIVATADLKEQAGPLHTRAREAVPGTPRKEAGP